MMMNDLPAAATPSPAPHNPDLFRELGALTRQLHETLEQLGVIPQLQQAASDLPDARSRLQYIAHKTGAAADKVLTLVETAKADQAFIAQQTRNMAAAIAKDPAGAIASGAVLKFVSEIEAATSRVDHHLTEIMLAQDFHDLTGQVVAKVVGMADSLEVSLVQLLVRSAPADQVPKFERSKLAGPVVAGATAVDVVKDQGEVDDLLASLGF